MSAHAPPPPPIHMHTHARSQTQTHEAEHFSYALRELRQIVHEAYYFTNESLRYIIKMFYSKDRY